MSEKKPVKRGVLSGLMGLFGDEEAAGQVVGSAPVAAEDEDPAFSPQATPVAQNIDDSGGAAPRPSEVVREAYEPGWYRISAAMSVGDADDEDDEDEEKEGEEPPGEVEPPVEEPGGAEAPAAEA